jgi:integrase
VASIASDPNGTRRVQFVGQDGKRHSIRLGKCSMREAEEIRRRIEVIDSARRRRTALSAEMSEWLIDIDNSIHARLASAGLVEARVRSHPTLALLLKEFFNAAQVKQGTKTTYKQTEVSLLEYFGGNRTLASITELEADKFRQFLKGKELAEATIAKRIKTARSMFKQALRWKMVASNPFSEVRAGSQTNRARMHFVSLTDAELVMAACPDDEWRLIFALSRFGGLRCPSEHLTLRKSDVDKARNRICVRSPKTEKFQGRWMRFVPIFPELKGPLESVVEGITDEDGFLIGRYRQANSNLRTQLERIIKRAGVAPWPRLFHNLRSSRQTELAEQYPLHIVCAWLGNTQAIAVGHYLQVRDADFEQAATRSTPNPAPEGQKLRAKSGALSVQKAAVQAHANDCTDSVNPPQVPTASEPVQKEKTPCNSLQGVQVTPMGFEPMSHP